MDHMWKELKRLIAANRQFEDIDAEAEFAQRWLMGLTATEALRKAGTLSPEFWLKILVGELLETYLAKSLYEPISQTLLCPYSGTYGRARGLVFRAPVEGPLEPSRPERHF